MLPVLSEGLIGLVIIEQALQRWDEGTANRGSSCIGIQIFKCINTYKLKNFA